ncbi:hypothetical protein K3495_g13101, partial [Podosphaera aphanis]
DSSGRSRSNAPWTSANGATDTTPPNTVHELPRVAIAAQPCTARSLAEHQPNAEIAVVHTAQIVIDALPDPLVLGHHQKNNLKSTTRQVNVNTKHLPELEQQKKELPLLLS